MLPARCCKLNPPYNPSENEVIASEPCIGNKPTDCRRGVLPRARSSGAKNAQLVRDEGRTILVAPPIRGYATRPLTTP